MSHSIFRYTLRRPTASRLALAAAIGLIFIGTAGTSDGYAAQRAFEIVSPGDTLGYTAQGLAAQPDGNGFYWHPGYGVQGSDPDGGAPDDGGLTDQYIARRDARGWSSLWLTQDAEGVINSATTTQATAAIPGMLTDGVVFASPIKPPEEFSADAALFLGTGGGVSPLISGAPDTHPTAMDSSQWATSDDLSTTVFATSVGLDLIDTDGVNDLYVRRGKVLSLISTRTDGAVDNSGLIPYLPGAASGNKSGTSGDSALNYTALSSNGFPVSQGASPVSGDGQSIVFSTAAQLDPNDTDNSEDLYLWQVGHPHPQLITDDERSSAGCPTTPGSAADCPDDASFVGMSADSSIIYFRSHEGLVDGDADGANDIYEYRALDPVGHRLKRATGGGTSNQVWPVTTTPNGMLFFVSLDRLGTDPPSGTGPVLYRWDGTHIETVAPLADSDVYQGSNLAGNGIAAPVPANRAVRATTDGSVFIFRTDAALDPADSDNVADLYLWRPGENPQLISGDGAAPVEVGTNANGPTGGIYNASFGRGRSITSDGSRVFFTTTDALTGDAGDNGRPKIYEWHDGDGLSLVSPAGESAGSVTYVDNDQSGVNVFFMTADPLVLSDADGGGIDVYDARIGGGFPEPPPPPPACDGDRCQPPPTPLLPPPALATPVFRGVDDISSSPSGSPTESTGKIKVKQPKRTVRGARTMLRVAVPEPGKLRTSGSGLKRSYKTAERSKTYKVRVRLSKRSVRRFRRKHRVEVRVTVRFTPKHGKRQRVRVRVTFKRGSQHGKQHHHSTRRAIAQKRGTN